MQVRKRKFIQVAAVALATMWPLAASAQVNDKALAESLFQEGRELMKQGSTEQACGRFEQSQKLEPKIGTLLNIALCHEALGRTASAWGEFVEVAELARRNKDDKREELAKEHAKALEAKLSRLVISRAGGEPELSLSIDGRRVDTVLLGTPIPLDPGKHRVEARAPGHKAWVAEILMPAGPARSTLDIPALDVEAAQAAAPPAPPPPKETPTSARPKEAKETGWPTAAWVGFGVAGVGGLVGIISGGVSLSQTSSISGRCFEGRCPKRDANALSTANDVANVSNVAFGVAAAGAVVGIIALVAAPSRNDGERSARPLQLAADARGLRVVF